ncbi:TauD/TfdA family dioxygenase [Embleya sp. AB8]|uniref:TauD/TfdA family dioxygenase n=1 Tax=Embleya sp. AB8 TaxID=3156304 RepID=UPI003C72CE94
MSATVVPRLDDRPATVTGAFVEQPYHPHVAHRERLLDGPRWLPEPDGLPRLRIAADAMRRSIPAVRAALTRRGIARLDFDRCPSTTEFLDLGAALGTVMETEINAELRPYVEQRAVLNLRHDQPGTTRYDLALIAANYLNLHTEIAVHPLPKQPRLIALMCVEPPERDCGGQTVFVPMAAVRSRLSALDLDVLAATNCHDFPNGPPMFSRRNGLPVFCFRDFGGDVLRWRYTGPPAEVGPETVRSAIGELLAAMYDPAAMFGVHWAAGTVVIFDNWAFFHGRSRIRPVPGGRNRHFKQLKLR